MPGGGEGDSASPLFAIAHDLFNGAIAVTAFFVISGFCIHHASRGRSSVPPLSFWARRLLRIGIPLFIAVVASKMLGPAYRASLQMVLWTIYCEAIYYFLYPFLVPLIARVGIMAILAVSLVVCYGFVLAHPEHVYVWSFGTRMTWLICAPKWLAGAALAAHLGRIERVVAAVPVWAFRAMVLALCVLSRMLAHGSFGAVIGYTWTMPLFALFAIAWLAREIAHAETNPPLRSLEALGAGTYSIYLTHKLAITGVERADLPLADLPIFVVMIAAIGVVAWAFYVVVEHPSHGLARAAARRVAAWNLPPLLAEAARPTAEPRSQPPQLPETPSVG